MNRTGGALWGALLLIVLLGGLGGLAVAAARLRGLAGDRTLSQARARTVAEAGVERAEASWDPILAGRLGVGAAMALPPAAAVDGAGSRDTLLRLGRGVFMIRSVGEHRAPDGHLLARAGTTRIIRLEGPAISDSVAASVGGGVNVTADSGVRGEDAVPAFWDSLCPPPGVPGVGVAVAPGTGSVSACPGGLCITGAPAVVLDSTLPAGLFTHLGAASLAGLLGRAEARVAGVVTIAPVATGGVCDRRQADNWGDPLSPGAPCGDYFPIIATTPGAEVIGGAGQGLLLATGNLALSGTTRFHGVILAQGDLSLEDAAEVSGAVLVQGSLLIGGTSRVQHSQCALRRALEGSARPLRAVPRGTWRWP